MKKILTIAILLLSVTFKAKALTIKRVVEVKIPVQLKSITFFYRDSSFSDASFRLSNPQAQDALIRKDIYIPTGTVIRYSFGYLKDGHPFIVQQSFMIPETTDTIKFELGTNNYRLQIKGGLKFFIQEALETLHNDPIMQATTSKAFLDEIKGRNIIDTSYKNNKIRIDGLSSKGLVTPKEHDLLFIMAKTDYYFRLLTWARKNNRFEDITAEMEKLQEEKEEIQSVMHSGLTDVFSSYFGYIIDRDELNPKEVRNMVNSLINLGWGKGITAEFIGYSLGDQKIEPIMAPEIYGDLRKYLNGAYEDKLVKISKILLPKLTDMEKIAMLTIDGKKLSLKQLMDRNPNQFILIDFWASWCKPCREQAPFFEKNKKQFVGKNIVFTSLSLDEDDKIVEWKKALKDDGLINAANQYKLLTPNISPLFKNFKIGAIPRYALINTKGQFVDSDFLMPSDVDFVAKLLRLIKEK